MARPKFAAEGPVAARPRGAGRDARAADNVPDEVTGPRIGSSMSAPLRPLPARGTEGGISRGRPSL
jgi:hypothetical protein